MKLLEKLLNDLTFHAKDKKFKFKRLYSLLYKKEFYYKAIDNLKSQKKFNNLNKKILEQIKDEDVDKFINSLRDQSYKPISLNKTSNLSLNNQYVFDQILEEILCIILKIIYLPLVNSHTYGMFTTSPHTALLDIQKNFKKSKWSITCKNFYSFQKSDFNLIINFLNKRIIDNRFLNLIRKFLNAGYLNNFQFNKTYSKFPVCSKLGNYLINLYLIQFDNYINQIQIKYNLNYCRYENQWILSGNSDLNFCNEIYKTISQLLKTYEFKMINSNLEINQMNKGVIFLEYLILIKPDNQNKVILRIPRNKIREIAKEKKLVKDLSAKNWMPIYRPGLIKKSDFEIIQIFNKELFGYYQYFSLAQNLGTKMNQLKYLYEYSCLKTLAHKHKTTIGKFKKNHRLDKGRWGIIVEKNNSVKKISFFKNFKKLFPNKNFTIDFNYSLHEKR